MKKTFLIAIILMSGLIFKTATAQFRVGISINIATQPAWGPVGYDHVEYYYLPDIDAFYYVPNRQYIYLQRGRWIFSASLPPMYRNYDLYSGYKVVINEPRPYRNAESYRTRYSNYRGNRSQEVIRNSNDSRYFENRGHPRYGEWKKNGRDNGRRGNNRQHRNGNDHND